MAQGKEVRAMRIKWPLMLKSNHQAVQAENYLLRDALKEANKELLKHRRLISSLRDADPETTDRFMRAK